MKKILLTSAALFSMTVIVTAQSIQYGFTVGGVLSNMVAKYDGSNRETGDPVIGLNIGWLADIPVGKHFSFQPALTFLEKGAKDKNSFDDYSEELKMRMHYVEMPLNLLYNARSNKGTFFIGGGPAFAYALNGKIKTNMNGEKEKTKMKFGDTEESDLKPFDFGGNVLLGYRSRSGFLVSAIYNMSISNLIPGDAEKSTLRNHYFGIKIGKIMRGRN